MDDRELVDMLRSGDPQAPGLLFDRYHGVVYGLCFRMMRHRQDAEDVVQETFLRALGGIAGFDAGRPLRPWMLGIAANRCRTALVRRSRLPHLADSAEDCEDHRPGLRDPDDLAEELRRALDHLRPKYRTVVVLFHEQGLPYEEISQAMNRPVGTIKTWLHRARGQLAEYLTRRGVHC